MSVEALEEIQRDLVIVEGGAICFDLPEFFGVSRLELSLQFNRLMVFVFDDETKPQSFVRKLLDFDDERAIGCVHGMHPGLVHVLVLDNAEPARIAPAWVPHDDEPGVLEVDVRAGGQHTFDLLWQPQSHVGFQLPKADLQIQTVYARSQDDSGEWSTWVPVPLQRVLSFGGDVAQWKLQRVADLEASIDHSLVLTPGKWQIRIDGIDSEKSALSYVSPGLDLKPESIILGTLTPYVPETASGARD